MEGGEWRKLNVIGGQKVCTGNSPPRLNQSKLDPASLPPYLSSKELITSVSPLTILLDRDVG